MIRFPFTEYLKDGFEIVGDDGILTYKSEGGYFKTHIRNVVTAYDINFRLFGDRQLFKDVIDFYSGYRGKTFLIENVEDGEDLEARFSARPLIDTWLTCDKCIIKIQLVANTIPFYGND